MIGDPAAFMAQVEHAFASVTRGRVGVREATLISDLHDSPDELRTARLQDTERYWTEIPATVLEDMPVNVPNLDEQTFMFLLPAILRWSVEGTRWKEHLCRMLFSHLVPADVGYHVGAESPARLAKRYALSPEQLRVVVVWLEAYAATGDVELSPSEAKHLRAWHALAGSPGGPET